MRSWQVAAIVSCQIMSATTPSRTADRTRLVGIVWAGVSDTRLGRTRVAQWVSGDTAHIHGLPVFAGYIMQGMRF